MYLQQRVQQNLQGFVAGLQNTSQASVEWANGSNAGNGKIIAGAHVVTPQEKIIGTFTFVPPCLRVLNERRL
jgi:hypothetical protein